ncbi:hypothetical protein NM208_g11010 [Fusarium decemcellulare]|uniref:Uncharacterized protein n=1 Tax=Fusarium decemcellulare TaxID=57161 RepID=A0ACC1RVV5_9HYPO|nr:hypothetical protein NM208_g11010 [Fusarium decemcellulare]
MPESSNLQAALNAATNEVTVAVANLNFDFSLVKIEAPKEYQDIGSILATARKEDAQNGQAHITARRLGALFSSTLPSSPRLIQAYGERCSQIARDIDKIEKPTPGSIFGEYAGLDATSVWAAATSGPTSIQVHLLSCLLARLWSPAEAISIWVELVNERRRRVIKAIEEGEVVPFSDASIAALSFSRKQLAYWDSAARAWLRHADLAESRRLTQLRLIINNIAMPVNTSTNLFESVMEAWMSSMNALERLISGEPLRVTSGGVLLALSAWHIYPDLLAPTSTRQVEVHMGDELIQPGGILTVGIGLASGKEGMAGGVSWSLPLSYYRSHGPPVRRRRALDISNNHVTFDELSIVALGCILRSWQIPISECDQVAVAISHIASSLNQHEQDRTAPRSAHHKESHAKTYVGWLESLATAANLVSQSPDQGRRLLLFGHRRMEWLDSSSHSTPLFGLLNTHRFVRYLKDAESRISLLRRVASKLRCKPHELVIRYALENYDGISEQYGYATALPVNLTGQDKSSNEPKQHQHVRWLPANAISAIEGDHVTPLPVNAVHANTAAANFYWEGAPAPYSSESSDHQKRALRGGSQNVTAFELVCGDPLRAAIFQRRDAHVSPVRDLSIEDVVGYLATDAVDVNSFLQYLGDSDGEGEVARVFSVLSLVRDIHSHLRQPTISLQVASRSITSGSWVPKDLDSSINRMGVPPRLTTAQALSCLILCQSGDIDIDPQYLHNAIAVHLDGFIYVHPSILADPAQEANPTAITRVLGSINRPGVTILLPPGEPMIRYNDPASWRNINHLPFQGEISDEFSRTVLQLNLTEWTMPIAIGAVGDLTLTPTLQEAVVSCFDSTTWIADLDVLNTVCDLRFLRRATPVWDSCPHSTRGKSETSPGFKEMNVTALSNWDELLEVPDTAAIVLCRNNWAARLAATAISVKNRRLTVTLPDDISCNECIYEIMRRELESYDKTCPETGKITFIC